MIVNEMIEAMTREIKQSLLVSCGEDAEAPLSPLKATALPGTRWILR